MTARCPNTSPNHHTFTAVLVSWSEVFVIVLICVLKDLVPCGLVKCNFAYLVNTEMELFLSSPQNRPGLLLICLYCYRKCLLSFLLSLFWILDSKIVCKWPDNPSKLLLWHHCSCLSSLADLNALNQQDFCFHRGAHILWWPINQVRFISSTWLQLTLLIPMEAVKVYVVSHPPLFHVGFISLNK